MVNVDIKYKIPVVGKYNKKVYTCPYCNNNMLSTYFQNAMGFASAYVGLVMITECDKCFEKFYSHSNDYNYTVFLEIVKEGENKFYK